MRIPIKSIVVLFVAFNFLMASLGAEFERKSIQAIKAAPPMAMADVSVDSAQQKFEIIRNSFYFFMVCGGAVLGAAIALIFVILESLRKKKTGAAETEAEALDTYTKRCMYFALAVFFSIAFTPMLIRSGWVISSVNPEICWSFATAMAIASWWLMRVVNYCLGRLSGAAKDRGIKGVQEELTGRMTATAGVAPPPSSPTK